MRKRIRSILALLFFSAASAAYPRTLEDTVLDAINAVRTDPAGYGAKLKQHRALFVDQLHYRRPGDPALYRAREGVTAVDEAIAALGRQAPVPPIQRDDVLARAAEDHTREQGGMGTTGHISPNGDGPGQRVKKRGGGIYVAETVSYGMQTADDVVRQFILDEGVPSRGHRRILLDPTYRFAGVGCGPHKTHSVMCTIDWARTASGNSR